MRSLRSGVAVAAIAAIWSSAAFGFNLFGSADDKKPRPEPQQQAQAQDQSAEEKSSLAKSLAANLNTELEKARTQRALGDLGGAARALAQMILVVPDDARVIGEYGKVLVQLGRSNDAIAFLKRAIELSPNDWTLYAAIGAAFDQENKFADAQRAYQRGLELKPDSAALYNNYAMSRMLAGDLPMAQNLIARAQSLGNDPKIAHNASLMTNLRSTPQAAAEPKAEHPVAASVLPAKAAPATVKTAKTEPRPARLLPPVVTETALPAPGEAKTASVPANEKPVIVRTDTGPVMMQPLPKDPKAGPMKTAEDAASPPKSEATAPPRALASARTPDLRAAAD